jgi:hypothetical protein
MRSAGSVLTRGCTLRLALSSGTLIDWVYMVTGSCLGKRR